MEEKGGAMNHLRDYTWLLKQSGQLEEVDLSDDRPISRGFWTFLGFLLGLIAAWWVR